MLSHIQVNTNGLFSFGLSRNGPPQQFPVSQFLVAPFWSDIDTTHSGMILYEKHTDGALLAQVSEFISGKFQITFSGTWMLVAEWRMVPEYNVGDFNVVRLLM